MTYFAHTESGPALEPQPAATAQDYIKFVSGGRDTSGWKVVEVPAGTEHGATPNGHGGWTNPVNPAPVIKYKTLTRLGFVRLCQGAGGMTGQMLVACNKDENFAEMWIKFQIAEAIERGDADTQAGLVGMNSAGYLPNGADAVNAAWPTT